MAGSNGGIWLAIVVRAWYRASLIPHGNMISRTSCIELVNIGPTDVVSIARHWKIGPSRGAVFLPRCRR